MSLRQMPIAGLIHSACAIIKRLRHYEDIAHKMVMSHPNKMMTPGQVAALNRLRAAGKHAVADRLEKAFVGNRMDVVFRGLVQNDQFLMSRVRMTPYGRRGVDVLSSLVYRENGGILQQGGLGQLTSRDMALVGAAFFGDLNMRKGDVQRLRARWQALTPRDIIHAINMGHFSHLSLFGCINGRLLDLRAIVLPERSFCPTGVTFRDIDMSLIDSRYPSIDRCSFFNCVFDHADLSGIVQWNTHYENCTFRKTISQMEASVRTVHFSAIAYFLELTLRIVHL
jgi:hypothetical protein